MIYKNLKNLELIKLLPMIIINNMQYHYEQNQKQNQRFIQVSNSAISYFKNNNILATPVKGLRFLNTIYSQEPGIRILSDIDFIASAKNQSQIRDYMKESGFDIYLINDQDVFCSVDPNIKSYFYIKLEEADHYGKLRIEFNFSYPDNWIELIQSSKEPVYEFLYLCTSYYDESYCKVIFNKITTYNYVKLIDIHEYYCKYLTTYSMDEIYVYADQLNIHEQVQFTIICLSSVYTDILFK